MKKMPIVLMATAILSGSAYAESGPLTPNFSSDSVSVSFLTGLLGGESKEFVYTDTGRKESELNWKIKNVAIVRGGLSWDAYPSLTFNARGWASLGSGSSYMDDWDWNDANQSSWTDHSFHPDTSVNHASEFDLNLKGWLLQNEHYKAGVVAGYQETRFSWTAFGGSYIYDNGTNVGTFPEGEPGIGYSQRFSTPYVGLTGHYRVNEFEFNALVKFSGWVHASDRDEHYMRDLTFYDTARRSNYYDLSVSAGYYVTPSTKVFAEFDYSDYKLGKGGTLTFNHQTGKWGTDSDTAGLSNRNYTLTAGLQHQF